jgi:hypothetical protein
VDFERRAPARWARLAGWVVMLAILGLLALGFLGAARLWRGWALVHKSGAVGRSGILLTP